MLQKTSWPRWYLGIAVIGLGIAAAAGWWLLSPVFIDTQVNEPLPVVVVAASPVPAVAETKPTAQAADVQPQPTAAVVDVQPQPTAAVVPTAAAPTVTEQIISKGAFYNLAHAGTGEAVVYQLADGSRILRLQNFSVDNGPDLYVYLVPIDPVPNVSGSEIPGYYSLGRLKGNIGNQNYELPADLDLTQYKSVVIWCQAFAVPFAAAPLTVQQPQPTAAVVPTAAAPTVTEQVISKGAFYNLVHAGTGEAVVYQLADGSRILRLQNFSVDNGPDLYVYLVPIDPVPNVSGSEIPGYYSLGRLKGNIGNQNYELPADLDLTQYKSVVIWCQAFAVPFAAAPLTAQ